MPGKKPIRSPGDRRLEIALLALKDALDATGAPWSIIGGVAVIAHGVRRMTTDIDAVIEGGAVTLQHVMATLARHDVVPRIPDAEQLAATSLVLLLRHRSTGVDIDLSFGWTEFESAAIATSREKAFGRVRVPMAGPQQLVVFTAIAARPTDLEDATALLLMHPSIDIAAVKRLVTQLSALAEAPELVAGLDAVIERARAARGDSPEPSRPHHTPVRKPRKR